MQLLEFMRAFLTGVVGRLRRRWLYVFAALMALVLCIRFTRFSALWNPTLEVAHEVLVVGVFLSSIALLHLILCFFEKIDWRLIKAIDYLYYGAAFAALLIGLVEVQDQITQVNLDRVRHEYEEENRSWAERVPLLRNQVANAKAWCDEGAPESKSTLVLLSIPNRDLLVEEQCQWIGSASDFMASSSLTAIEIDKFIARSVERVANTRMLRLFLPTSFNPYPLFRSLSPMDFRELLALRASLDNLESRLANVPEQRTFAWISHELGFYWAPLILSLALALRISKVTAEVMNRPG